MELRNIFTDRFESLELPGDAHAFLSQAGFKPEEIYMAPGLFDLQINGYRNLDFNEQGLSVPEIEAVVIELLKDGVTGFFPTLITNDPHVLETNLEILNKALAENPLISACVPGFHLEGPFISPEPGFSGAHNRKWIRKPDWSLFERWQKIAGNHIKLITLSPEYEGSPAFIEKCHKNGVKVAIGHSSAGRDQIRQAIAAGASLSTHLGNAIPAHIHRHENSLFEQLAEEELYASIITDGYHLPESLIKIILRSKPGKVFLISDSTRFTGLKAGVYDTPIGGRVELDDKRKLTILNHKEYFAGSASSLFQCVEFICQRNMLPLKEAWYAASVLPQKYLNRGYAAAPKMQEFVLFAYKNQSIRILLTKKQDRFFLPYR